MLSNDIEGMDDETRRLLEALNAKLDALTAALKRYEPLLERFLGGGILSTFRKR